MKIKQIPQDFIVNEIFDLNELSKKDEGKGQVYYYFLLKKTNYTQIRAIEKIAKIFSVSRRDIHFAGSKDKDAITSQLISIKGINKKTFENNLNFLNEKVIDLELEYLGIFNSRVNLSDNIANYFEITIRELDKNEIKLIQKNIPKLEDLGLYNYFDSQRFGYANNSHLIGKNIIKNNLEEAVYIILTAVPKNPSENLLIFTNFLKNNWEKIKISDSDIIDNAINLIGENSFEKYVLEHLKKYKNDFPGAFRTIHKKQRTLYINAYQSYIYNETLNNFNFNDFEDNYELELMNFDFLGDDKFKKKSLEILNNDDLETINFKIPHMPEIMPTKSFRLVKLFPKKLKLLDIENDELNENKFKIRVSFELNKGSYATNIIKNLL